jgi:hypothetical protein
VQLVASVAFQVNVEPPPLETVVGEAASVTAGLGEVTLMLTDCVAAPPDPVQVNA